MSPMPTYDYQCNACEYIFDEFNTITARDEPCAAPCPKCAKCDVRRGYINAPSGAVDTTMSAETQAPGFNEVMERMKKIVPKRDQWTLDSAQQNRAGRYGLKHRR